MSMEPIFILLNRNIISCFDLAIGGMNGGELKDTQFPNRMEVDYVRGVSEIKRALETMISAERPKV